MPTKDTMLSVSQVCDLQPGDEQNASWINPGFSGVVQAITSKKTKAGKNFWPCVIADVNEDRCTIEMSLFTAPKFREGDLIEVFGKGLRRTEYNGNAQATLGRETQIEVTGGRQERREPAPRPTAPRDDSRGGEENRAATGTHYEPETAPVNSQFHPKMNATSLFYLHCLSYARKINTTLRATGHPEMSPDHFQACVSTLFIAGDRNGLAIAPPPSSKISPTPTEEPKKAPPARREPDPLEDEDVPF